MHRFRKNEILATSRSCIKKHIFPNCSSVINKISTLDNEEKIILQVNSCLRHFMDSPLPIWKLCKTRLEPRLVQMRCFWFFMSSHCEILITHETNSGWIYMKSMMNYQKKIVAKQITSIFHLSEKWIC